MAIVAIVGRPMSANPIYLIKLPANVSLSLTIPGVTRDRVYATAEWRSRQFQLVDTAVSSKTQKMLFYPVFANKPSWRWNGRM